LNQLDTRQLPKLEVWGSRSRLGETVDVTDLAAAYTAGLLQNHPFIDGDKRTGFVVGILFLELNGARFTASEEAATQAVLGLAAGSLERAGYAAFLRENITRD
jgi:death on curing protein